MCRVTGETYFLKQFFKLTSKTNDMPMDETKCVQEVVFFLVDVKFPNTFQPREVIACNGTRISNLVTSVLSLEAFVNTFLFVKSNVGDSC